MNSTAPGSTRNRQSAIENRQFFKQVYAVVRTIPRGKVLTYGQIATLLGFPYMARQVGWAMHGSPKGLPWQRVVGAGGKILINSLSLDEGPLLQRKLLELEGVRFLGQRVDMDAHQFIPSKLRKFSSPRVSKGRASTQ
ncbi:MAG: MGMT family protein [Acidobacteria bacterium]|nr:MGMT family protein [Acidobacteriota bacterium]